MYRRYYLDDITLHLKIAYLRGHLERARAQFDREDLRVTVIEHRLAYYEQMEQLRRALAS